MHVGAKVEFELQFLGGGAAALPRDSRGKRVRGGPFDVLSKACSLNRLQSPPSSGGSESVSVGKGARGFPTSQVISRRAILCGRAAGHGACPSRHPRRPPTHPSARPGRGGGSGLAVCLRPPRPAPPGAQCTAPGTPGGHPGRGSHVRRVPSARWLPGARRPAPERAAAAAGVAWALPGPHLGRCSPAPQRTFLVVSRLRC